MSKIKNKTFIKWLEVSCLCRLITKRCLISLNYKAHKYILMLLKIKIFSGREIKPRRKKPCNIKSEWEISI